MLVRRADWRPLALAAGMPYAKPSILQSWRRAGGYERTSRREITVAPHSDPEHSEVGTWSAGMNKDSSEFVRRGVADIASVLRAEGAGERASGSDDLH